VSELEAIDVQHLGRRESICCFRQGDVIIDPGPQVSSQRVIDAVGDEAPRAILLTHIHLDHAAAAGSLMQRWPETELWVHERGARHMIDPTKLIASATRLYGDRMDELWGEIVPVSEERVRVVSGGEEIGDFGVIYTPGHASHHVSYIHRPSGTAFVGDVAGVRRFGAPVMAPTPPPDIDLEAWERSLALLEEQDPQRLAVTHFGIHEDVDDHVAQLRENLQRVVEWARDSPDAPAFAEQMRGWLVGSGGQQAADSYFAVMPPEDCYAGLERALMQRDQ
jgi:glyoxylase-like metal-dependent hydrolase (beta-lactamase superfamily II)